MECDFLGSYPASPLTIVTLVKLLLWVTAFFNELGILMVLT